MTRRGSVSRRSLLTFAGGGALALAGCGGDDEPEPPAATATTEPSPTPELTPTATQEAIETAVAGYADPEKWAGRTLTVAAWGGEYQNAQEEALFTPFGEATGATVQIKRAGLDELRDQVKAETVAWDVLTAPMEDAIDLARAQLLEPIDYNVVDKSLLFADEIALQYAVGAAYWSTTMLYLPGTENAPQDWSDFWDVPPLPAEGEPPPDMLRSLRRSPVGTLEFALLADGVMPAELYPLDVERAFASLDRIRAHVRVWWQESKEPIELVAAGQVGMVSGWYTRLWQLNLNEAVRVQWFGGMLSADAWIVPKGAPNADIAMDFINFATRAAPNANFARLAPFGPVNRDSFALLRPDRAAVLPSAAANKAVQFVQNWNYWADNRQELTARFEDWFLAEPEMDGSPESEG